CRVQAGRAFLVALALDPEPQLKGGAQRQFREIRVGDGLMTSNDVLHGMASSETGTARTTAAPVRWHRSREPLKRVSPAPRAPPVRPPHRVRDRTGGGGNRPQR